MEAIASLELGARNMFDEMSDRSGGWEIAKKVCGNGRLIAMNSALLL